jgi:hypothetical protein
MDLPGAFPDGFSRDRLLVRLGPDFGSNRLQITIPNAFHSLDDGCDS